MEAKSESSAGARKYHHCPQCKARLKRVYSKKREKHYWHCPPESGCDAWYADRDGEPVLRPVRRSEPVDSVECPECHAPMVWVEGGKFGSFWSCSRRQETDCTGTRDCLDPERGAEPTNITPDCPADESHGPMRRREGSNGVFLGCRKYPKCDATMEIDDALDDVEDADDAGV